ncbi:Eukaryotic translation initiation factor 1A [Microtus ochrogaster]|uniref:Eukaryotic translation initiation factor 1A n=1 Tax=Microtus ochrogaster TaxID=79684 RepID=A0A8J6H090_MICOH|nr:Eukaryotic translation initiation factor 1A [Microtus ochrogaster]
MLKNKGKGAKNKRRGKNENESGKRELVFKEDGQEYAQVIKMLGNGMVGSNVFQRCKEAVPHQRKVEKKARSLKAYGELPEHAKINETDTFGHRDDDEIQFDDIGHDDEDVDDI